MRLIPAVFALSVALLVAGASAVAGVFLVVTFGGGPTDALLFPVFIVAIFCLGGLFFSGRTVPMPTTASGWLAAAGTQPACHPYFLLVGAWVTLILSGLNFTESFYRPVEAWDAVRYWAPEAKKIMLWIDEGVERSSTWFFAGDHPAFISSLLAVNGMISRLLPLNYAVTSIWAAYGAAWLGLGMTLAATLLPRGVNSLIYATLILILICNLPLLHAQFALGGSAEAIAATYLLLGVCFVVIYVQKNDSRSFGVGGSLFFAPLLIKDSGWIVPISFFLSWFLVGAFLQFRHVAILTLFTTVAILMLSVSFEIEALKISSGRWRLPIEEQSLTRSWEVLKSVFKALFFTQSFGTLPLVAVAMRLFVAFGVQKTTHSRFFNMWGDILGLSGVCILTLLTVAAMLTSYMYASTLWGTDVLWSRSALMAMPFFIGSAVLSACSILEAESRATIS